MWDSIAVLMVDVPVQPASPRSSATPGDSERTGSAAGDENLMAAIAAGEESAFQEFFGRHSSDVYALCLRVLEDRRDAEDVLLDVFWEIWCRADRYDSERGTPRTYLMLLARSRAIDRHRERAARREKQLESTAEIRRQWDELASRGSPQQSAVAEETRSLIREALGRLDEAQREPLELAFFEGLSHREIAETLQSPLGTVKTRIRKGLAKLRSMLRELDGRRD
jgi:RNA polymerase sigma-70 factor (ECF subfamily)